MPSTVIRRSGVTYVIFIFNVWRSALQLFTVGSRQQLARLDWLRATRALLAWLPEDILYLYRKCCLWGYQSLSWHSEPLSTWRRNVTYDFPPSVWISTFFTVMWRRRHLSTVIHGAISDWRRKFTTLNFIHDNVTLESHTLFTMMAHSTPHTLYTILSHSTPQTLMLSHLKSHTLFIMMSHSTPHTLYTLLSHFKRQALYTMYTPHLIGHLR